MARVSGPKEDAAQFANYWSARPGAIAMTEQRGPGRPSDYNEDIATTICDRLADGESLRAICASAGMPNKATVLRWIGNHEKFREQYQWARQLQADDILGRILEIADDSSRDYVQKTEPDGKVTWVEDRNHIAHCQFRINALFRIVDLLAPKKSSRR